VLSKLHVENLAEADEACRKEVLGARIELWRRTASVIDMQACENMQETFAKDMACCPNARFGARPSQMMFLPRGYTTRDMKVHKRSMISFGVPLYTLAV